jgi:N-acyl-D-aspartate/D-glutamate deacylase
MKECDLVITGATLVDGTGAAQRLADVGVTAGKIAGIGPPNTIAAKAKIDGQGKTLTPGFVDIHSHADYTIMLDGRGHSSVLQGVTSIVVGNCGSGIAPVSDRSEQLIPMNTFGWRKQHNVSAKWRTFEDYLQILRDSGVGPNVFPMVAHGPIRLAVAGGDDRTLDQNEITAMQKHLYEAMSAGAVGFSTGLEYSPGISSNESELTELAKAAADFNGVYATHCRNRGSAMDKAAAEAVAIARAGKLRLQMSHFVRRPYAVDNTEAESWKILDDAQASGLSVFADIFPFDYGPTPLSVLIPPKMHARTRSEMAARLQDASFRQQIIEGLGGMFEAALKADLVRSMYVAYDGADGSLIGLSLADVAEKTKLSVAEAAIWLLQNAGEDFSCVTIVENWVRWEDLTRALSSSRFFIMGDGASGALDGPAADQRFALADWGYAPRFLSQFIRDLKLAPLEDAVHRMTKGPAQQFGLRNRGSVEIGNAADLVLFDLSTIGTAVSPSALKELPQGISHVLVNGIVVVDNGNATNARPGVVGLRH